MYKFVKIFLAVLCAGPVLAEDSPIAGSWSTESYVLKDGTELSVSGLIFFTQADWTVLFFVEDGSGNPARGSGEGGTYELDGDRLTFQHTLHLSAGSAVGSLAEAPLRMVVREAAEAASEPCRIELDGSQLTIHFPSGNRMGFSRSSR